MPRYHVGQIVKVIDGKGHNIPVGQVVKITWVGQRLVNVKGRCQGRNNISEQVLFLNQIALEG